MSVVELYLPLGTSFSAYLNEIWPEPYATPATDAFLEDWNSGQIYQIFAEDAFVGITGYFLDDHSTSIYLRWTGILPEYRRKGYAAKALTLLRSALSHDYAGRKLVELVPDNEYGAAVKQFFLSQGFQEDPDVYTPPNECSDWPTIAMSVTI